LHSVWAVVKLKSFLKMTAAVSSPIFPSTSQFLAEDQNIGTVNKYESVLNNKNMKRPRQAYKPDDPSASCPKPSESKSLTDKSHSTGMSGDGLVSRRQGEVSQRRRILFSDSWNSQKTPDPICNWMASRVNGFAENRSTENDLIACNKNDTTVIDLPPELSVIKKYSEFHLPNDILKIWTSQSDIGVQKWLVEQMADISKSTISGSFIVENQLSETNLNVEVIDQGTAVQHLFSNWLADIDGQEIGLNCKHPFVRSVLFLTALLWVGSEKTDANLAAHLICQMFMAYDISDSSGMVPTLFSNRIELTIDQVYSSLTDEQSSLIFECRKKYPEIFIY